MRWLASAGIDDAPADAAELLIGNAEIDPVQLSSGSDIDQSGGSCVQDAGKNVQGETSLRNLVRAACRVVGVERAVRPGSRTRTDVIAARRYPIQTVFAAVVGSRRAFHLKRPLAARIEDGAQIAARELRSGAARQAPEPPR